jgi:prepilin-type N-terminal cleavage/methylation domain-containing protein
MLRRAQPGLTLVEILVALSIVAILLVVFTQLFSSSLRASGEIYSRAELLHEGQIAQQIIASRLQSASFVYPPGYTLQFASSGYTTRRPDGGYAWTVGRDPIVAMILPPSFDPGTGGGTCSSGAPQFCYRFFAYYPVLRSHLVAHAAPGVNPGPDPANEGAWVLMEYRGSFYDGVRRTLPTQAPPAPADYPRSGAAVANILVDYVQPATVAPTYTLFAIDSAALRVDVELRLLREQRGRALRVPASEEAPLSVSIYPRNWE